MSLVYRAVSNRYDKLRSPIDPYMDFEASNLSSPGSIIFNRVHKMFPPDDPEWTLYLDGTHTPNQLMAPIVDEWLDGYDMALFTHPHRACVYEELDACVKRRKCSSKAATLTADYLRQRKIPEGNGLFACGVIARRSPMPWRIQKLMAHWWRELVQIGELGCYRDQIALILALNAEDVALRFDTLERINEIDADIFDNPWFTFRRHGT